MEVGTRPRLGIGFVMSSLVQGLEHTDVIAFSGYHWIRPSKKLDGIWEVRDKCYYGRWLGFHIS